MYHDCLGIPEKKKETNGVGPGVNHGQKGGFFLCQRGNLAFFKANGREAKIFVSPLLGNFLSCVALLFFKKIFFSKYMLIHPSILLRRSSLQQDES